MLQKPLAFLLLVSHINFFMFIAQVDEVDAYDAKGCRVNDVNSLVEYIHDIVVGSKGKSRPDEDDDTARYFHIVKLTGHSFSKVVAITEQKSFDAPRKIAFPYSNTQKLLSVFYDVVTPPPRLS